MTLYLNNQHPRSRISRLYFEKRVRKILHRLHKPRAILGITFVTDGKIRRLNRLYRGKNQSTDVLSFPMMVPSFKPSPLGGEGVPQSGTGEGCIRDLLGDVVISVDTARRQAIGAGRPLREEMLSLIIHGVLHLLGYDHIRQKDWIRMRNKEEELWQLV